MHSQHRICLPPWYKDFLPSFTVPNSLLNPPPPPIAHPVKFKTMPDGMGMFCIYPRYPGVVHCANLADITDASTLQPVESNPGQALGISADGLYSAFSHPTAGLLMAWQYSGGTTKSANELDHLWTYIQDPNFNSQDDTIFSHDQERKQIERYLADTSNPFNMTRLAMIVCQDSIASQAGQILIGTQFIYPLSQSR